MFSIGGMGYNCLDWMGKQLLLYFFFDPSIYTEAAALDQRFSGKSAAKWNMVPLQNVTEAGILTCNLNRHLLDILKF